MDPASHVAFGRTLVELTHAARARRRGIAGAAMLGALSPDIDALVMPFGWDRYLAVHEIGTHSATGTFLCAAATAALLRTIRVVDRDCPLGTVVAAAWIGAISHVLLDMLSSARLRPAWPLADPIVSLPAFAMADPWGIALFAAAAVAIRLAQPARKRRAAVMALAALAAFVAVKGARGAAAVRTYADAAALHEPVRARVVEAEWASLDTWLISDSTELAVRRWRAGRGAADLVLSRTLGPETANVAASRSLSTVRNFRRAHELAFHTSTMTPDGLERVLWSDIRFCWQPTAGDAGVVADGIACGLWFGGDSAAAGRPVRELVKVGTWTQTRAPSPARTAP